VTTDIEEREMEMFQPGLLKKKRILITGGGTGLGRAMAQRFLELGAAVYICGRREEVLRDTCAELATSTGGDIRSFACDVRDREAVEKMIERIWFEGPLNVLVNNAAGNFIARTEELSPRAWEAVLGIVLHGTINLTMACGRRWLNAGQPAGILNISATYAAAECGSAFVVPSAVAKAGVKALTTSLAVEWGPRGIRLNEIAPGPIPTQGAFSRLLPRKDLEEQALLRNPLRRFGTTEEFANLAAFVVSDACTYLNGETIIMDGGAWLRGASGFGFLDEVLTDEDWQNLRPKKR
jgi:NAD(P)-dependent dehydrogenase (short-subunit alcohol dehydrogenase family)